MSEALIFSICMLALSIYAGLGTFLNWKSAKKSFLKDKPFTVYDKLIAIVLIVASIVFLVFVLVKGY